MNIHGTALQLLLPTTTFPPLLRTTRGWHGAPSPPPSPLRELCGYCGLGEGFHREGDPLKNGITGKVSPFLPGKEERGLVEIANSGKRGREGRSDASSRPWREHSITPSFVKRPAAPHPLLLHLPYIYLCTTYVLALLWCFEVSIHLKICGGI